MHRAKSITPDRTQNKKIPLKKKGIMRFFPSLSPRPTTQEIGTGVSKILPATLTLRDLGGGFASSVGRFFIYQLVSALILTLGVLPLFKLAVQFLIHTSGREAISSGDYLFFLLSPQGVALALLSLLVLSLLIVLNINGLILIAASQIRGDTKNSVWGDLKNALRTSKIFLHPASLLILLYVGIIVPLSGVGLGISALEGLRIPNFITSVIYANPLYLTGYFFIVACLAVIGFFAIFVFHAVLLQGTGVWGGVRYSAGFIHSHAKAFFFQFIPRILALALMVLLAATLFLILAFLPSELMQESTFEARFVLLAGLLLALAVLSLSGFILAPFALYALTAFFVSFAPDADTPTEHSSKHESLNLADTPEPRKKPKAKRRLILCGSLALGTVGVLLVSAAVLASNFDKIFVEQRPMQIVAHRAGGNLAPENSVAGVDAASEAGAAWSEFDVRRSKDGVYVINHDPDFARTTGDPRTPEEMTWNEIKQLRINNLFGTQPASAPVPSLSQMLDAGKNKIGMFVELKGPTADEKMADDVVAMIREKGMEDQAVLLSLDYKLITYIEQKYPAMDTGYLFYFSVGESEKLAGDYLIMEEDTATPERIAQVHSAGKKAVVWTVNTPESIDKFLASDADAVITDYVLDIKKAEVGRSHRSDFQRVLDSFWSA